MKILIKGAGDLATGIASRLYCAGHCLMMTEIGEPLTVRRTVALSRAVYEGRADVEEMTGLLAKSEDEARRIMSRGDIPVLVDPRAECLAWYRADVIVDAIIAKRNLGTKITDAPFVVGVGPGFTAGVDCHCVVETKRGHTLGNVIWKGGAIPNTGIPGNVGGYTVERLLRASADGIIEPKVKIGDIVEKGQLVALTGGEPVYAQMPGVVRGMLQNGARVRKNLKIGDIDARSELNNCFTISDKAKSIGGGVLEAVARFERMKGRYAIIALDKSSVGEQRSALFDEIDGRPLCEELFARLRAFGSFRSFVVTEDRKLAEAAEDAGIAPVITADGDFTLRRTLTEVNGAVRGALVMNCPPLPDVAQMQALFNSAVVHPSCIIRAREDGPTLWDSRYFARLLRLERSEDPWKIAAEYGEFIRAIE